ncbi:DnaJ subfamily C member 28 [Daphnia magna]|uniref:DnaJ subfamily C member 28 n=1 Tax=Daphnia magna TaxID=35525 RepID=A0A164QYZ5_9CRUS|nr:DnaJ subfamily C member 28 [Daphnia magna]
MILNIQPHNTGNSLIMKALGRVHLFKERSNTKDIKLRKQWRMCIIIVFPKFLTPKKIHLFGKIIKQQRNPKFTFLTAVPVKCEFVLTYDIISRVKCFFFHFSVLQVIRSFYNHIFA